MSLRVKIQQIAQETATQVIGAVMANVSNNNVSTAVINGITFDSSGNMLATVTDSQGNTINSVSIASNRPLGVGDTIALYGTGVGAIGQ